MTEKDIGLCTKADAALGESLLKFGVPRFQAHQEWPARAHQCVTAFILTIALLMTALGYMAAKAFGLSLMPAFGAALLSPCAAMLCMWGISAVVGWRDAEKATRWLRIAHILNEVLGDSWTETSQIDIGHLRFKIIEHFRGKKPQGVNDYGNIVRQLREIEGDLGFRIELPDTRKKSGQVQADQPSPA